MSTDEESFDLNGSGLDTNGTGAEESDVDASDREMSGRSCTSRPPMQISVLCGRLVLRAHDITSSLLSIYLLIGPSDISKGIFGAEERIAGSQEGASCFQKVRQQSRWT